MDSDTYVAAYGASCWSFSNFFQKNHNVSNFCSIFYDPQRSRGKVIFSQARVPPPGLTPPSVQTPPPPLVDTRPQSRHPPGSDLPRTQTNPHPRSTACCEIRATSGRYSSYWNACIRISMDVYENFFYAGKYILKHMLYGS